MYDLKLRKEHCVLTHHDSTINCISFSPDQTHLITGSCDGVLAIIRTGNWQLEKVWEKAHKGSAILDVAVHPSGKLALTLGADHTLCTWNLIKGRQAYIINLNSKSKDPKNLEHISWGTCGNVFVLYGGRFTEIWSIEKGGILNVIEHKNKVTCCIWDSDNSLLVGYENGNLGVVNLKTDDIQIHICHDNRIKSMVSSNDYIITGASNGDIKIWDKQFKELIKYSTGCRITCLCMTTVTSTEQINKQEDISNAIVENKPRKRSLKKGPTVTVIQEDSDEEIKIVPKKKNRIKKSI